MWSVRPLLVKRAGIHIGYCGLVFFSPMPVDLMRAAKNDRSYKRKDSAPRV
jgi:hypothetical protein